MVQITKSVTINRPRDEVYECWRELDNLPRFIPALQELTLMPGGRSHWVVKGPASEAIEWDAEIVVDRPGEMLAWRTLEGANLPNEGEVRFTDAPAGRGTEVRVRLQYDPPAGGQVLARLLGNDPEGLIREALRRFKQVLETGEVVRSDGSFEGAGEDLDQRPAQPMDREVAS